MNLNRVQACAIACIAVLVVQAAFGEAREEADLPEAAAHVEKAREFAGEQFASSLFFCDADSGRAALTAQLMNAAQIPPTQAFDDLYFVGNQALGAWVLETDEGLILIDALDSAANARDLLVPGIEKLGLDPNKIRYVIITHGHFDHFGGAKYLQDTYGAHIALSEEDWALAEATAANPAFKARDAEPPRRDIVIRDGEVITLGGKTIRFYITPGHTPGTISPIIPAQEGGEQYKLIMMGGTGLPSNLDPNERNSGLRAYSDSVERLMELSGHEGAVGLIATHPFADGSGSNLEKIPNRQQGQPNPLIIGTPAVQRYFSMVGECVKAAIIRAGSTGTDTGQVQASKRH